MKTTVFATFRVPGFHCWADAPKECFYLSFPHRHVFHVRVEVSVHHNDRDVEFIQLRNDAEDVLRGFASTCLRYGMLDFGFRSCEMLAEMLGTVLANKFAYAVRAVEVSEDGENGAKVEFSDGN